MIDERQLKLCNLVNKYIVCVRVANDEVYVTHKDDHSSRVWALSHQRELRGGSRAPGDGGDRRARLQEITAVLGQRFLRCRAA